MGMKRYFRVEQPRVRLDLLLILSAVFLLLCNVFFSLITKQTQSQKIQQIEVLMSDYLQVAKQLREAETGIMQLSQEMLFNGQADSTTVEQLKQRMALLKQQAAEAKAAMEELKRKLLPLLEDVFEKQKPKKQNEKKEPKVWT